MQHRWRRQLAVLCLPRPGAEHQVFVSPPTESTKAADFIHTLEEKQEFWHEMMATSAGPRYYNPSRRLSSYRLPLPSQSKPFLRYQAQYRVPHSQQPWRPSERGSDLGQPTPPIGPQRQYPQQSWRASYQPLDVAANGPQRHYPSQPFKQTFMPQHQYYPITDQHYKQLLSLLGPNRDTALCGGQITQSTPRASENATNRPHAMLYQAAPRQPYQSGPTQHAYQHAEEKGVYSVDCHAIEQQPEGFHTTFEPEEKELAYLDESFDEVFVNFVGIEAVYSKCHSSFPSKSKLHMHIKSECVGGASSSASPQPSSSIPVVVSKAVYASLGSGFGFRGWAYATTAVTLTPEHFPQISDPDSTACLDIGCGVTLVDRHWLLKYLPN